MKFWPAWRLVSVLASFIDCSTVGIPKVWLLHPGNMRVLSELCCSFWHCEALLLMTDRRLPWTLDVSSYMSLSVTIEKQSNAEMSISLISLAHASRHVIKAYDYDCCRKPGLLCKQRELHCHMKLGASSENMLAGLDICHFISNVCNATLLFRRSLLSQLLCFRCPGLYIERALVAQEALGWYAEQRSFE